MNLAEQLFNECSDAFEKVKPQLTEHVMSQLKKYGHTHIFFDCLKSDDSFRVSRYPDGGDYAKVSIKLTRHVEKYFKEQGLRVNVRTWDCNNGVRCIDVAY